ncbi:MAG: hypothetical protein U0Q11_11265 [Vicinamibacterales bacterium]
MTSGSWTPSLIRRFVVYITLGTIAGNVAAHILATWLSEPLAYGLGFAAAYSGASAWAFRSDPVRGRALLSTLNGLLAGAAAGAFTALLGR